MRYLMLAAILLPTSVAFANDQIASCEITKSTIVSLSPAGLTQVSNLRLIQVVCNVPARPFPNKPDEFRNGLRTATTAYEIAQNGDRKEVPSETKAYGFGGDLKRESVSFCVYLPLDPAEREIEARRYVANLKKLAEPIQPGLPLQQLESPEAIRSLSELVSQHRAGHFQVSAAFSTVIESSGSVSSDLKCSSKDAFLTASALSVIGHLDPDKWTIFYKNGRGARVLCAAPEPLRE